MSCKCSEDNAMGYEMVDEMQDIPPIGSERKEMMENELWRMEKQSVESNPIGSGRMEKESVDIPPCGSGSEKKEMMVKQSVELWDSLTTLIDEEGEGNNEKKAEKFKYGRNYKQYKSMWKSRKELVMGATQPMLDNTKGTGANKGLSMEQKNEMMMIRSQRQSMMHKFKVDNLNFRIKMQAFHFKN